MPSRPESHRLEDLSIRKFEQALPATWVCRRKDKDYGIDLEVEVFNDDGSATGLIFFVQIKATNDQRREKSVRIDTDRINYLMSFDAPAMIVRYGSRSDTLYWSWVSNVIAGPTEQTAKTVNVKFTEANSWSHGAHHDVVRTLRIYRVIRGQAKRLPIGLEIRPSVGEPDDAFELVAAVNQLRERSSVLKMSSDPDSCLPIAVWLSDGKLCLALDVISSIQIQLGSTERLNITSQLCYALAYMAGRAGFESQLYDLAALICELKLVCQSRSIAAKVASYSIHRLELSSEIIRLNSVHGLQDEAYTIYLQRLLDQDIAHKDKMKSVVAFFDDALSAHGDRSQYSQSPIHYSLANFLYNAREFSAALAHYNMARKKNPDYLQKAYFFLEVGASLYFLRRYMCSAESYARAYSIDPSERTAYCCGDALLFSGSFPEAKKYFELASASNDRLIGLESQLKIWLTEWGIDFVLRNPAFDRELAGKPSFWLEITRQCVSEAKVQQAVGPAIVACFLLEFDTAVWADAVFLALNAGDAEVASAVMECALWRCGFDVYEKIRKGLVGNGYPTEMIDTLDLSVSKILEDGRDPFSGGLTMRSLRPSHFDTLGSD